VTIGLHPEEFAEALVRKNARSISVISGAKAALKTVRQPFQDAPRNQGPNMPRWFIAETMSSVVDRLALVGSSTERGTRRDEATTYAIPKTATKTFECIYPFGCLGSMSETPPLNVIVYAPHQRGFPLASQRSPTLNRYCIRCPIDTDLDDWIDARFWVELNEEDLDHLCSSDSAQATLAEQCVGSAF
jgi:hypothetical protein